MSGHPESFSTRVYVIGEVVMSVLALLAGVVLVYASPTQGPQLVGAGLVSAVTVFWFQRRQNEQSTNQITTLANGKLTSLLEGQASLVAAINRGPQP